MFFLSMHCVVVGSHLRLYGSPFFCALDISAFPSNLESSMNAQRVGSFYFKRVCRFTFFPPVFFASPAHTHFLFDLHFHQHFSSVLFIFSFHFIPLSSVVRRGSSCATNFFYCLKLCVLSLPYRCHQYATSIQ